VTPSLLRAYPLGWRQSPPSCHWAPMASVQIRRSPAQAMRSEVVLQPSPPPPAPHASSEKCLDLVACSHCPGMPRDTALSAVVLAPGSLGAVYLGAAELVSSCYPGALPPSVSWRQVEGSAEQACSRVVATDKLLWEVMAMVDRYILHPIWVSLKKRRRFT
jgi:hypothetical protein